MTITNLTEDDRNLIMWDVREWCDTYEMYNPGYTRRQNIRFCFTHIRRWLNKDHWDVPMALGVLKDDALRIPERFERAQAEEAAYWHRAPRSWE